MRKKIVAGNWKMNNNLSETINLINDLKIQINKNDVKVMIAPAFTFLHEAVKQIDGFDIEVISQNINNNSSGAYTGEVSAEMLKSIGVNTTLIGHSERRAYYNEDDELLLNKLQHSIECGMNVIFCFGEELADRKSGKEEAVVGSQIKNALFHLGVNAFKKIVLAYEPVWAIGTGETASPEQAQDMHAFIRITLADKYGSEVADNVSILYGGSVKPNNAKEIFGKPDVDGGLIGGASLKAEDFFAIVNAF